jgi:type IV secretory pathway VirB4 component
VTLLIQIKAESKQKLRKKFEEVKRELDRMGLVYGNINFRQHEALEMLQPFRVGRQKGMNGLQKDIEMVFQTDAIANSYPFTQVSLFQKDGNLIATATSGSPIIFNICDPTPPNRNATVLGFSGSRKTTLLRTIILAQLLNPKNQQVLIMDFENEYTNLALNYKQQIIEFTRATGKDVPTINIFQVPNVDT